MFSMHVNHNHGSALAISSLFVRTRTIRDKQCPAMLTGILAMRVWVVMLKRTGVREMQGLESQHPSLLCCFQFLSPIHTSALEAGDVSQWYSSCLACVKP